jgi:hypothetical protein
MFGVDPETQERDHRQAVTPQLELLKARVVPLLSRFRAFISQEIVAELMRDDGRDLFF